MANGKQPGLEEQLTPEIYGALWRFCLRLCGGRGDDAQDLLQDSLARGLLAFHKLRDPLALKSWLFAIARRRFLDLKASRAWREREQAARGERNSPVHPDAAQADAVGGKADIQGQPLAAGNGGGEGSGDGYGDGFSLALAEAMAGLPATLREVLELHYIEGLSLEDCARVLACSPAAAKQRLYRGREALRAPLERGGYR
ncbi:RNA polymerase sigma factor [bacterium]|nr:RNA polymerase sigma factor [bacterium]